MTSVVYEYNPAGLTATDATVLDTSRSENLAKWHQMMVRSGTGGATAGTVAINVWRRGDVAYRALKDIYGAAVSVNLASPELVTFTGLIDKIQLVPTGLSGGDGTFGANLVGLSN